MAYVESNGHVPMIVVQKLYIHIERLWYGDRRCQRILIGPWVLFLLSLIPGPDQ